MLSTAHDFLYLHVPKTAGNSIQQALLPFSDDRMVLRDGQDGTDRFGISGPVTPSKHAYLAEYEARMPGVATGRAVLISVRHPFERAVSAFFHQMGAVPPETPFDEEAFWQVLRIPVFGPMVAFLRLGGALHTPRHVIRHETLERDFDAAVRALYLPGPPPLGHVNRSRHAPAQHRRLLDSPVLRDAVEAHYREDMDYFGYDSYQPSN